MKLYRYRFNKQKFIHNILVPTQFSIGFMVLMCTMSNGNIGVAKTIINGVVGIALMVSATIY